jgi:hypothetical protein
VLGHHHRGTPQARLGAVEGGQLVIVGEEDLTAGDPAEEASTADAEEG